MRIERRITVVNILINSLVVLAKIYSGLVFNSYSLVVSGYYSLCNMSNDFLGFGASVVRGRRASRKAPFGYGNAPMFSMIFYGLLLCFLGVFIFVKAFFLKYTFIDLKILLCLIVFSCSLLVWANTLFRYAQSVQSEILMDMTHSTYYDAIIVISLFFFVVLGSFIPVFDLLGSLYGAVLIFFKGVNIIIDNVIMLKGQNDRSKKVISCVENAIKEHDEIFYSNVTLVNIKNYYKVILEILVSDEVCLSDLIIWEEAVKEKILCGKVGVKKVDFLVYKK